MGSPCLVLHGGAWNIPDGDTDGQLDGIGAVLGAFWARLAAGASALDTVTEAVAALEDDARFNAGRGSRVTREGTVELDAAVMDGEGLRAGAVGAVRGIRNPVRLARRVLEESEHVFLVAGGAEAFAERHGVASCADEELLVGRELERYRRVRDGDAELVEREFHDDGHLGTVGAVAIDGRGRLAAATSTGGTQDKASGRIGDSPIIGAGTYAASGAGAVSCTGWGEAIVRIVLAHRAVGSMAGGEPAEVAVADGVDALKGVGGRGGLIAVDRRGGGAVAFNTPRMTRGIATGEAGLRIAVDADWHEV